MDGSLCFIYSIIFNINLIIKPLYWLLFCDNSSVTALIPEDEATVCSEIFTILIGDLPDI